MESTISAFNHLSYQYVLMKFDSKYGDFCERNYYKIIYIQIALNFQYWIQWYYDGENEEALYEVLKALALLI